MTVPARQPSLDATRVEAIRRLNDDLRINRRGGRVVLTAGVANLRPFALAMVFRAVTNFRAFRPGNDPYDEHDMGTVTFGDQTILWKIDYYDPSMTAHSSDAADPAVTCRVLTIMRADEY